MVFMVRFVYVATFFLLCISVFVSLNGFGRRLHVTVILVAKQTTQLSVLTYCTNYDA